MSHAAAGDVTSDYDELENAPPRSKFRPRFSLLALFIFITLACLALAWLVQPKMVVATSLFEVQGVRPTMFGDESTVRFDEREFQILKNTQLAKLSSHYVLNSALRKPGVAALPILASKEAPVAWLQENLEVDFPGDGEILAIRLRGPESDAKDLATIVDAVAKAYEEEVIHDDRSKRLTQRDLLAKSLQNLTKEIERDLENLEEQHEQSGGKYKNTAHGKLQQVRVESLIDQMRELQRLLERADVESIGSGRIRLVQPAVVGPE